MTKPKPTHGGARKGAGRPPKPKRAKFTRLTVFVPPGRVSELKALILRWKLIAEGE